MLNCNAQRLHRRRRTGPALTCWAIACASDRGGGATRGADCLASRYSRSAIARRPFNEMPDSAAYRRPRSASASGSRKVIAIGEPLRRWYHDDTTGRCASVHHRYAAFFAVPVSKYDISNSAGGTLPMGSSSRRWLNQSTHSSVAYSTASRCRHGPRRWITSVL